MRNIEIPKLCPSCGSVLHPHPGEVNLYCENPECPGIVCAKIEYWVSKEAMNLENIGPAIIKLLYDKGYVKSFVDLYKLSTEDFMKLPSIKEKSASNMYNSIQNSKNNPLSRFICALGIRNVGKETANILAEEFGTLENFLNASPEDLYRLEGVGDVTADEIYKFITDSKTKEMIEDFKQLGINPAAQNLNTSSELKGLTFVLTGTLQNMTRDEASELIRKMGGKTASSVSKNTSYVIAGENAGSKLDKAQKLGVIILNENEFLKMTEGKNI